MPTGIEDRFFPRSEFLPVSYNGDNQLIGNAFMGSFELVIIELWDPATQVVNEWDFSRYEGLSVKVQLDNLENISAFGIRAVHENGDFYEARKD